MQFCHFWPTLQNYFWPTLGHKCRSRQIFGRAKDFCLKSPKLAKKVLCDFCQQIFSHKQQFLVWPPKKGFMCFSANVGHHFLKSNNVGRHFCSDFQRFWPDFNKSKLWRCTFTPCTPASYTTALENPLLALAWKKILPAPMFRGTCSSAEMLKGYMARESLGTPAIYRKLRHSTTQAYQMCVANIVHPTTSTFQCDSKCKTFWTKYDLGNLIDEWYIPTLWLDIKKNESEPQMAFSTHKHKFTSVKAVV